MLLTDEPTAERPLPLLAFILNGFSVDRPLPSGGRAPKAGKAGKLPSGGSRRSRPPILLDPSRDGDDGRRCRAVRRSVEDPRPMPSKVLPPTLESKSVLLIGALWLTAGTRPLWPPNCADNRSGGNGPSKSKSLLFVDCVLDVLAADCPCRAVRCIPPPKELPAEHRLQMYPCEGAPPTVTQAACESLPQS